MQRAQRGEILFSRYNIWPFAWANYKGLNEMGPFTKSICHNEPLHHTHVLQLHSKVVRFLYEF